MSLFGKILNRAAVPGTPAPAPAWPKGTAMPLRRQETDEERVSPLRPPPRTGAVQRQEEEEAAQTLHRQDEEEEAQPLRRQDEDEEARTLRRQEEQEDQEMQALRRAGDPMASVPAEPLPASEDGPEEELPDMRALRREAPAPLSVANGAPGTEPAPDRGPPPADIPAPPFATPPDAAWAPSAAAPERPRVTIDQIDVVIHEDAPGAAASGPTLADLSRRMNALYLRGL